MVLESLTAGKESDRSMKELFLYGVLYASIAVILGLWIFHDQASLIMVFLTVFAAIPLMYTSIKSEERKSEVILEEKRLLKFHSKAITFFMALFLGILIAFVIWYSLLPSDQVESLFSAQISTIKNINSNAVTNQFSTGDLIGSKIFIKIFNNNVKVLIFCLFFSFFYGAGAIFILTWNASVIAGAAGAYIRNGLSTAAAAVGLERVSLYFGLFTIGVLRYLTHGIFEIFAYFAGGLAGGIISVAVIHHEFYTGKFQRIIRDVSALMVLALILLIIGAIVEVYITPAIF
ncbi:MAG: stage II sporulation protein M [Nanoarchaeota archaeon]